MDEIIQTLDDFHMSKDDWDTLVVEFGLKGVSAEWDKKVDGKVRAALTRQYNKTHQEVVRMRKSAAERDDGLAGSDDDEEEEEDDLVKREFHGLGMLISLGRPRRPACLCCPCVSAAAECTAAEPYELLRCALHLLTHALWPVWFGSWTQPRRKRTVQRNASPVERPVEARNASDSIDAHACTSAAPSVATQEGLVAHGSAVRLIAMLAFGSF